MLVVGCLVLTSCKSGQTLVASKKTAVLVQLKKDVQPEDLQGKSPFNLQHKIPKDWTTNTWKLTFGLSKYSEQELVNYLMSLDKVVAVDGYSKSETPPIRESNTMKTKKQ